MKRTTPRLLVRGLPVALVLLAAVGLGGLAWRVLAAERVLAERSARAALVGRAREAVARLAQIAARRAQEAATADRAAVMAADGRFVRPPDPWPLRRLRLVPGRDPEGRFYLDLAGKAESVDGDPDRAEELFRLAASEERDPGTRRLALYRVHALLRRRGRPDEAAIARRAFLRSLDAAGRRSAEALVIRSLDPDETLEEDLLACLGGADDAIVRGLLDGLEDLEGAGRAAREERRRELARIARLRLLVPPEGLRGSGLRLVTGWLLAWTETADGGARLAESPVPGLGARILEPGETIESGDDLVETVAVGDWLRGVRIAVVGARADVDAEVRHRTAIVVGALLLLLLGGGGALALGFRAVRREAEAARLREEFLARVGHDLRTPLARMRLYAETLGSGRVSRPQDVREFAGVIQRDSERLSGLVRTVLDLDRVERALRSERLDLEALVGETAQAHRPLLEEAGMTLVLGTTGSPVAVEGDADALRGAIGNLIENAWRHAVSGGQVEVRLDKDDTVVEVTVEDRGPGLPEGLGDRVFTRFVRGPAAGPTGTGLGLAFVAEVAKAHGGGVRAEDRPQGGARFVLTLPRPRDSRREETA